MAELDEGFDANQHESNQDHFEVIPPGIYMAMIIASEKKNTRSLNGDSYLWFDWMILEGPYEGRHVFEQMTWRNSGPNGPKAMQIGRAQLGDLCRAAGKLAITDTADLHSLPMQIKVAIEPAKNDYPEKNRIRAYYSAQEDATAGQPVQHQAAAPATAAPPTAARPAATAPQRSLPATPNGRPAWQAKTPAPARVPS